MLTSGVRLPVGPLERSVHDPITAEAPLELFPVDSIETSLTRQPGSDRTSCPCRNLPLDLVICERVEATPLRGQRIHENGRILGPPTGRDIKRPWRAR